MEQSATAHRKLEENSSGPCALQGTDTELNCGSVLVNTVEQDLIDHGVRWGPKPLVERLAEEPRWFRVLNHPTRGSQEVLPWLHDLIADKHAYEVQGEFVGSVWGGSLLSCHPKTWQHIKLSVSVLASGCV